MFCKRNSGPEDLSASPIPLRLHPRNPHANCQEAQRKQASQSWVWSRFPLPVPSLSISNKLRALHLVRLLDQKNSSNFPRHWTKLDLNRWSPRTLSPLKKSEVSMLYVSTVYIQYIYIYMYWQQLDATARHQFGGSGPLDVTKVCHRAFIPKQSKSAKKKMWTTHESHSVTRLLPRRTWPCVHLLHCNTSDGPKPGSSSFLWTVTPSCTPV